MDTSAMASAMKASISEVLEQMFFMVVDFYPPNATKSTAPDNEDIVSAALGFQGSAGGTFILRMPLNLAKSVSADFLGTEPGNISAKETSETVLEMVNMLAGSTLGHYDHQAVYDLQIPRLLATADAKRLFGTAADAITVCVRTVKNDMAFCLLTT